MALCEQCGSISIARARPDPADRLVTFFTAKRPFVCWRCGWRGRQYWSDEDLSRLMNYGAGGAEPDPALAALDDDAQAPVATTPHHHQDSRRHSRHGARPEDFDLGGLDLAVSSVDWAGALEARAHTPRLASSGKYRGARHRHKGSRRHEIVMTVAASTLMMFVILMMSLMTS